MISIDKTKAEDLLRSFNIPPKPESISALQEECQKTEPSIEVIAKIVSQDVSLAASVLKAINSPIYGLSRSVTDIQQSILFLGIKSIETLATCLMLKQNFYGSASISLERFWDRSVELAQLGVQLVSYLDLKERVPPEDIYANALFQDCGIPPMALKFKNYKQTLIAANQSVETPFTVVEERAHETNHAILGYFVASSWNMPKSLCQYVLMHHERKFFELTLFDNTMKHIYALLKIGNNIINQRNQFENDAEWASISDDVLDFLCLSQVDYDEIQSYVIDGYFERNYT